MSVPKRLLKLGLLTLVLAVAAAFAAGCGGSEGSDSPSTTGGGAGGAGELTKVNMGTQPWIGFGPWAIAVEQGFDRANGIELNLVNFTTDADREQAFASGKTDMSNIPTHAIAKLLASDTTPFKTVLFEDISTTADAMLAPSDITSIEQLKGRKIAYEEGTTSDLLLRYALREAGLSYEDIQPVPIAAADAGSALVAGRVDIAVTYEPYLTAAKRANGDLRRLYAGEALPGLLSDVLIASETFAAENPDAVAAVLRTWQQAVDFLRENPEEGQAIIAEAVGAPVEDLATSFEGDQVNDVAESLAFMDERFPDLLKTIDGILKEQGALRADVDAESTVDLTFAQQATGQ